MQVWNLQRYNRKILYIMKKKIIFAAFTAAVGVVSCGRPSNVTKIAGVSEIEGIDEVNVVVKQMDIDTLVPVVDGKFAVEIPADVTVFGTIQAGNNGVRFIPDGTKLDVVISEAESTVKSSYRFVQEEFAKYQEYEKSVSEDLKAKIKEIRENVELTAEEQEKKIEELYEAVIDEFSSYNMDVVKKNVDNAVSLAAVQNIVNIASDEDIDEAVGHLSEKVSENPYVQSLKKSIAAKKATAEGKMFTDFTVEDSDGKTVKFSDFVGKGKYVLVDFWASWCGPCKREIPNIKTVYDKYKGKDFDVLSVAVWDRPEDTKAAAKEHGVVWSQIINAQQVPTSIYGIDGIPHIMLIGPDGIILKRGLRGDDIEEEVARYVKAN